MRVTVVFEDSRLALDVHPEDKVRTLKSIVNRRMVLQTMEDKKVGKYLEMRFGGAPLQDDWVLQDIGVASGSVIKSALKIVEKPKLNVYLAYNQENLLLTNDIDPITMKVSEIRSILSAKLGIPVSIFRLSFDPRENKSASDTRLLSSCDLKANLPNKESGLKELYDMNTLYYYGIEIGSKIRLDLWDGWNELILAAIAGHEKTVSQYFSWERPVRHFQQRAALYIASYFGHMVLATAMMKYGAKACDPVGIHPTRKWCYETEHVESRRCPLHVACARGHLPILRLFIRSSPLCFITKDENDRTPIQIVLRHRYRACFEYLLARQWGRKTGKEFSFPVTLYCRILQWCERAKARTLLMHGTDKSTYRGLPPKEGALVGAGVLVDGFSKKPANSVPFSLLPKPAVPPEKMLSAIALTKRRLRAMRRRRSSSRSLGRRDSVVSIVSVPRRERLTSAGTIRSMQSYTSIDKSFIEMNQNGSKLSHERQLLSSGNLRSARKITNKNNSLSNVELKSVLTKTHKNGLNNDSATITSKQPSPPAQELESKVEITLPPVTASQSQGKKKFSRRDSRISFKPVDLPDDNESVLGRKLNGTEMLSRTSLFSQLPPPPAVKRPPAPFKHKVPESGIPLPPKSLECQLKPFFYWSPYQPFENPVQETMQRFETYRGVASRQHAVQCLTVTSSFTEKPWLQQLRMAVCLTRRGVKKKVDGGDFSMSVSSVSV